jgi:hypothetical protein
MSNQRRKAAARARHGRQRGWRDYAWKVGIGAGVLLLVVLGLRAGGVFEPPPTSMDLGASANQLAPGEVIGTRVSSQGNTHIPDGQRFSYNSTPPTSGSHWQTPASWGLKDSQEQNERTTHNLEHGGIVIAYSPTLAAEDVTKLKSLARGLMNSSFRKIILEPYQQLSDAKIAVTAWTWILKLPAYDETQITKFVRAHYQSSDAPEPNGP